MSDKIDDLLLQMQHLQASAQAAGRAQFWERSASKLKSSALKVAAAAQKELDDAEHKLALGEEMVAKARTQGLDPRLAAELMRGGQLLLEQNRSRAVKARVKVNYALDAMGEADRLAWQALQEEAKSETHAQLAAECEPGGALSTSSLPPAPKGPGPKGG